jgi:hypothetical protein
LAKRKIDSHSNFFSFLFQLELYLRSIEELDTGGLPLPSAERLAFPSV